MEYKEREYFMKKLIITEKPSVAMQFATALSIQANRHDGYIEDNNYVVTWCVGHLISMSYPEAYGDEYKSWTITTLPFIPKEYKYEPIKSVYKQYQVVKKLLNRQDVAEIYYAGDSAREGEYISRLVTMMAGRNPNAIEKRVWIDSQTNEEIQRGMREAKPRSYYDNLAHSGYMRAKEDYLIGINFSRLITIMYGGIVRKALNMDKCIISVGRVMTCVLGMIVDRENSIVNFVEKPFYCITGSLSEDVDVEWKVTEQSLYYNSPLLYNEKGFHKSEDCMDFVNALNQKGYLKVDSIKKKNEKKYAPLLFNLAELQSECSKIFKISPDETLKIAQNLYERKLTTYPRTDARVLTTAVCKEISHNLNGLKNIPDYYPYLDTILQNGWHKAISQTKYTNDAAVSDHYAIVPTGVTCDINDLDELHRKVYDLICKRFLSIFYPPAIFKKVELICVSDAEQFSTTASALDFKGYLEITGYDTKNDKGKIIEFVEKLNINSNYPTSFSMREGKTTPPKRYSSGSMILAMENAGNLIEEEELREQIKGSGIGTSATRAEVIKKLCDIEYIKLNSKTQILQPTDLGILVHDIIDETIPSLLNPKFTASWEKGLSGIADGSISPDTYLQKLNSFVSTTVNGLKQKMGNTQVESFTSDNSTTMLCPNCQLQGKTGKIVKTKYGFGCSNYKSGCIFSVGKIGGKLITENQLREILSGKVIGPLSGFTSNNGKKFKAKLSLQDAKNKDGSYKKDQNGNILKTVFYVIENK